MSHATEPINATAFAQALDALPLDALHSKAAELRNSITHLKSSNDQMLPFAEEGDQDCKDAMFENLIVIGRINERISLLRAEVEKRGMRWADAEVEEKDQKDASMTDADGSLVNGNGTHQTAATGTAARAPSGRLTDEELRARLQETLGEQDEEEGMHL